jgi:hypothetical protein
MRAARIGPTVCELDGPIPILKRSNALMAISRLLRCSIPFSAPDQRRHYRIRRACRSSERAGMGASPRRGRVDAGFDALQLPHPDPDGGTFR